ncbi:PREDICTED: RNA-binding protein 25-like isoform X2 [Brassica oleracea var. oleracea]|uniref:RNA-binding protein 25-like isoform X2 n=1 Tax=Brassica oleracea var. oleracea TaxID=109376 RepID=UPI0006A6A0CB|nr:PREDICTED: RNA-binding protein 25-like isoform X2 [Brassica oleracea var. oleracea]
MSSLTSVELNFLIFRYLQESGYEAGINKCKIYGNMVPPGALVKFVQKGLQYIEMEANLSSVVMLREMKRKERDKEDKNRERSKENDKEVERDHDGARSRVREKDGHEKHKERKRQRERIERETLERERLKLERESEKIERERAHEKQLGDGDRDMAIDQSEKENAGDEEHGRSSELMDITMTPTSLPSQIPNSDVRILEGHTSEVPFLGMLTCRIRI